MAYKSFAPCDNWYFVGHTEDGSTAVFPLAGWGTTEGGEVVGLMSPWPAGHGVPKLSAPPAVYKGQYKHGRDLTQKERERLERG